VLAVPEPLIVRIIDLDDLILFGTDPVTSHRTIVAAEVGSAKAVLLAGERNTAVIFRKTSRGTRESGLLTAR